MKASFHKKKKHGSHKKKKKKKKMMIGAERRKRKPRDLPAAMTGAEGEGSYLPIIDRRKGEILRKKKKGRVRSKKPSERGKGVLSIRWRKKKRGRKSQSQPFLLSTGKERSCLKKEEGRNWFCFWEKGKKNMRDLSPKRREQAGKRTHSC